MQISVHNPFFFLFFPEMVMSEMSAKNQRKSSLMHELFQCTTILKLIISSSGSKLQLMDPKIAFFSSV